ncbi:type II secretion system protein [Polaromonas sp.]|uniref:type IV pilus modification PilV family protein n=1 Tax=Polaromonas sp. TaxID=1869339 RepID=UPI0025E62689|nr:type II secretion system protein [Polaromonas sp.]
MRTKNRGMTLIEVLVAFVVLSLAMGVIMQIFSGGMRNARRAEGYSRAVFLAESRLAAVGLEQPLVPGEVSGQLSSDLRWRVTINPFDDGGVSDQFVIPVRLYEVRVTVSWNEDGRQRLVELGSLRLGPKQ